MLTIKDDYSIEFDENVDPEHVVELLLSFYSGEFSRCLANQLKAKCIHFKTHIKELFIETCKNRFESELCDLFINLNKPFFNTLDLQMNSEPPFISPLAAYNQGPK